MSDSDCLLIPTSNEFIKLCQTQILLLSQNLGAVESAVYLTQNNQEEETKLIPVFVYPPNDNIDDHNITLSWTPEKSEPAYSSPYLFLPINGDDINLNQDNLCLHQPQEEQFWQQKYQLIVPLVYEDLVLGLLATRRKEREWNQQEFFQVEKIANTIALGRILDQKQFLNQQKLKQQKQLFQLKNDHLDDFIHQIRNPLTALRTFAKLLLKKLNSQNSNYQFVENILRESDRLKNLIIDFNENRNNIDNKSQTIDLNTNANNFLLPSNLNYLEPLNIKTITEPLLAGIKTIAEEKNIDLTINIDSNLGLILGNEKALIEILNNLLDNAIKYTPPQGKIAVQIGKEKVIDDKEMIAIEISDTGYGIPPEDIEHIFERRYRGKQENSSIYGTGLGLAIVKDLATKMEAKIEFFSPSLLSDDQSLPGTKVIIWLLKA